MLHHIRKHKHHKQKSPLDFLLYFFVFTTPLFELPQAYIIYSNQDASDVSILTWGYFAVSSVAWVTYGFRKKIKPIMFAYSLYLLIETIIVIGIIKYS
jgi:uncharacterized protein with PQ loop repeat